MPKVRPGQIKCNEFFYTCKTRRYKSDSIFKSYHLYGIRPIVKKSFRAGIRGRNCSNVVSSFKLSKPGGRTNFWRSIDYKTYVPISNIYSRNSSDIALGDRTLDIKLRPRVMSRRVVNRLKETNRISRRERLEKGKYFLTEDNVTSKAIENGFGVSNEMAGDSIHHFTEEYYLTYLARHYDFSLTHNDLLSIDKDHIPVVVNMLEDYFNTFNDPELKLRHIELIDHNVYMNKLFVFSFSKVFIIAKMNTSTNPTDVYVTEFVAFSKYPKTEDMGKSISEVSSMIYKSLVARDLNTNCRLINMSEELNKDVTFRKIIVSGNNVQSHDVKVKSSLLSTSYYPYLDIQLLMEEYAKSDDKLLILYGENGSGKTKLSTILANNLHNNNYVVIVCSGADVVNERVLMEVEDEIYSHANKLKHVAVIIDDLDPKHLNRNNNEESNKFFNKLLTILDGNFDINLKFIVTTNHILREDADEPLYRSGRLFDSIYIRYLTPDEAKPILRENGINAKNITNFLSSKKDKVKQSDLAQFIRMNKANISRKYRLDGTGDNFRTKKVGFVK